MNSVVSHIEYLLRDHDRIVLPGWGVLLAEYHPARFDDYEPDVITPPSRTLSFDFSPFAASSLLVNSMMRREKISEAEAAEKVSEEVARMREEFEADGTVRFGRIGILRAIDKNGRRATFDAEDLSAVNARFYGLQPLKLRRLGVEETSAPIGAEQSAVASAEILPAPSPVRRWSKELRRNAVGIAASLAVIITLALFVLNPIRVENPPQTASIAKLAEPQTQLPDIEAENPAADDSWFSLLVPADGTAEVASVENRADKRRMTAKSVTANNTARREASTGVAGNGAYCVIVASFPTASQADRYIAENPSMSLAVLQKDGKFRVYAASASTYGEAEALKGKIGTADAWICRR